MTEESTDDVIPPEIFADEILARFPATNIQSTLKLVCKDWLNLISRPRFTRRQLLLGSNRSVRIVVPQTNGIISIDYKKHGCVSSSKEKEVLIPFPPNIECGGNAALTPQILGSCDGLILLADRSKPKSFIVFNPSTGKSELFAQPKQSSKHLIMPHIYSSWFGRHPTTGEYVLVLCRKNYKQLTVVELQTFTGENKLRAVQSCTAVHHHSDVLSPTLKCYGQERGILLDGVMYWPAHWVRNHTVSGYHIEDNKYFEISPPSQTDFKLGVMNGCLLSINKRKEEGVFEVWVMTKETRTWTKYSKIEGECNTKFEILSPLSFFPNGNIIMEGDGRILIRYDFDRNKATFLNRYHPPTRVDRLVSKAIVCADSLVSPVIVMEQAEQ